MVTLHPEVKAITDTVPARNFADGTIKAARAVHAAGAAARPPGPDMAAVEDGELAGVAVRVYRPDHADGSATVFFHGGGWVLGSIETHDGPCRYLAAGSRTTVISVEYRLAPEAPFPAALDDALAVTRAVLAGDVDGVDTQRVLVAGDSAGGNLAAVVAIELRGFAPALMGQLLIYPAVDAGMGHPSVAEFGSGPFLTAVDMAWFYDQYAPAGAVDRSDPRVSPLLAHDLADLPAALVITADNDVLRDEGEAFAHALAAAGNDASASRQVGTTHGFFGWTHAAAPSRAAMLQATAWIRSIVAR